MHYGIKIQGIILFSVLLFLQLFSLLGVYSLKSSALTEKMSQNDLNKKRLSIFAEGIIKKIEKNNHYSCLIPTMSSDIFKNASLDWWRSAKTCQGQNDFLKYYFVVESLGIDDCAIIDNYASEYFRLTILLQILNQHAKEILQTTFPKATDHMSTCKDNPRRVNGKRLSWKTL